MLNTVEIRENLDTVFHQNYRPTEAEPTLEKAGLVNDVLLSSERAIRCLVFCGEHEKSKRSLLNHLFKNVPYDVARSGPVS
nr:hypothetical protein [Sorangium cellulosum]